MGDIIDLEIIPEICVQLPMAPAGTGMQTNRTLDLSWLIDGLYSSNLYGSEYFL